MINLEKHRPTWWYGIEGAIFVWHGEWADPGIRWRGEELNYYSVYNEIESLAIADSSLADSEDEDEVARAVTAWIDANKDAVVEILDTLYLIKVEAELSTTELCEHCGEEVEIPSSLTPHRCPRCGKWICPCAMCKDCQAHCHIEREAKRLNEEEHGYTD
jgi:predicted RNA-binding Zn-ribbon protein involved in translation (DUF1610 family)